MLRALDPWAQLDLQGPGVPRLAQHVDVGLGNRVRVERAIWAVGRIEAVSRAYRAVDDEMGPGPVPTTSALRYGNSDIGPPLKTSNSATHAPDTLRLGRLLAPSPLQSRRTLASGLHFTSVDAKWTQ
jgi:hypothetical protein